MAKSNTAEVSIPPMEFKTVFDAATPEEAYAAVEDKRGEGALIMVPFDAIHPIKDFNIRVRTPDYEAHIDRIAQSIKDNGFFRHMPLKVFPAKEGEQNLLYLVGGYSRYEAAKRAVANGAKLTRLPVVATPKGATLDDLLIGLDKDNDGRPLSAFEKGILVKRMIANENDEDEVAAGLGISKQYVNDLLQLMAAPKQLHNMVINGEVAANLAIDLIKEHGSGKKALDVLKTAGATGERRPNGADTSGEGGGTGNRVTRSQVARTGGTQKAGKRLYEALIEYLIVLNSQNGPQTAMDFLLKWHEKDPETVKELSKLAAPGKKKKKATKPGKDERWPIKKSMSEEEKEKARAHNKRLKKRQEKAAAAAATTAAGGTPAPEADADPV